MRKIMIVPVFFLAFSSCATFLEELQNSINYSQKIQAETSPARSASTNERANPDSANWDIEKLDTAKDANYLSPVEKDVILEMNKVRSDPKKYAELYIKPRLQYFNGNLYSVPGKTIIQTTEGEKAVEGCYNALVKMQPVPLLYPEKGLSFASKDHVNDQSKTGQTGHAGSDKSTPLSRTSRYGKGSYIGENIAYGSETGKEIIIDLLIDDGVPSRGHRQNIMKRDYNQTGTAIGTHSQYRNMCVINYAKNYTGNSSNEQSVSSGSQQIPAAVRLPAPVRQPMEYTRPQSYDEAYSYRTDAADPQIRKLPQNIESLRSKDPGEYIRQAAAYIKNNSQNNFDMVKKIHDLIALTVRYDAAAYLADRIGPQDYANVLTRRLAVCEGYANVFQRFCDELGIECEKVHGYARGTGSSPFINDTPSDSNHAWNIVKINGACYLVDCTWDAGNLHGRNFRADYTTDYLFLKAEYFVYNHFPDDPRQQLLASPFSASDFSRLPFCRPKYFDIVPNGEQMIPKLSGVEKGEAFFEFRINEGFIPYFALYSEDEKTKFSNNVFVQKEGDVYCIYLSFPRQGNYLLRFSARKQNARSGKFYAEYGIIADEGSETLYPAQYSNFTDAFEIVSPLEMPLEKNKTYTFKVRADNTAIVALVYNKNFVRMTRDDDGYFSIVTEIPSGVREVSISTAPREKGSYHTLVTYRVK